jgi:hypothetical protein
VVEERDLIPLIGTVYEALFHSLNRGKRGNPLLTGFPGVFYLWGFNKSDVFQERS